ncbi:hypothetical protein [Chelativorans sp. YIM 93263]|uniref:hypothetical protein n=1 Tax=Chelativorans sp. YIM 93263 TaxID=2906648 RepID=UPI0023788E78|nr:hypothetical protein [Chelativorans sp. YIM 93263]
MGMARYAFYSGSMAGIACVAALAIAARCEGRSAFQPMNATSHWIYGETAASVTRFDPRRTGVGVITNIAACFFWALPLSLWLKAGPRRHPLHLLSTASALSAFAAFFDYRVVPKRLRPGWERAISRRSIAAVFGAIAGGMAAGSWVAQRRRFPAA